jgi:hypothetical protein
VRLRDRLAGAPGDEADGHDIKAAMRALRTKGKSGLRHSARNAAATLAGEPDHLRDSAGEKSL